MEIFILRHGKPDFELKGMVKANDLHLIAKNYNCSGVTDYPPQHKIEPLLDCNVVVCSDLARSIQSAELLGVRSIHLTDSMFRESDIPYFSSGSITLPLSIWMLLLRILWFFGYSRNGESLADAKIRSRVATQQLVELARRHGKVLLVGHGMINHLIARELLVNGWDGPRNPGKRYWQYGIYRYNVI